MRVTASVYMYICSIEAVVIFKCTFIIDTDGRGGVTVEVTEVTGTEANVTGLTPGTRYTFSVTAENAVSSQDTNINARTATATATTQEGGKQHVHVIMYMYMYLLHVHVQCI